VELGWERSILGAVRIGVACLAGVALVHGQAGSRGAQTASGGQVQPQAADKAATEGKPPMSDQFFKNVQVLKGIPVDQFLGTMGFIAASLSVNCTECHVTRDYSLDTPKKQKARQMMIMVKAINQAGSRAGPAIAATPSRRRRRA